MKIRILILLLLFHNKIIGQYFDTITYSINIEAPETANQLFKNSRVWRGADGAASIDLGNGKVLWLFSDTFICTDSSGLRNRSTIIRNSIAIQDEYDLCNASVKYYWKKSGNVNQSFFWQKGKTWYWTGHGSKIKDKLLVFLIKEQAVKTGLGFEAVGWCAVLIPNPEDDPAEWKMNYINSPETFGTIVGSASVLKDQDYLYAYGAVEPDTHEVYLLRWKLTDVYEGNLSGVEWWIHETWTTRKTKSPIPKPLFIGATEYSVHYDSSINKFIQVQTYGFGEGEIGLRMADKLTGPWSEPNMIYKPTFPGVNRPLLYSAKAHPELTGKGIYITYNVNSFDFSELVENQKIYFPQFILVKILKKK